MAAPSLAQLVDGWTRHLTIVVPSSPVPSNPDTATLEGVFKSFAVIRGLPQCAKLIQFDGPQKQLPKRRLADYTEFKARVHVMAARHPAFRNTLVHESSTFLFASHNLGQAVGLVNTTFMFILQHDFFVAKHFDMPGLLHTMFRNTRVKHVRLNLRANVQRGFDLAVANWSRTWGKADVPLTRTCGWSDSPHIASKHYYTSFVIPLNLRDHLGGRRKFMEESVHYKMQAQWTDDGCWALKTALQHGAKGKWPPDFDKYGTYLYGYAGEIDGSYTVHRSLRGSGPQWGLQQPSYAYLQAGRVQNSSAALAPFRAMSRKAEKAEARMRRRAGRRAAERNHR